MGIIIYGSSKCSLCGRVLHEVDDLIGFWAFIAQNAHHLWEYSDSAMHKSCFISWPHRDEFIELHNQVFLKLPRADGLCRHVTADAEYFWYIPETGELTPWD